MSIFKKIPVVLIAGLFFYSLQKPLDSFANLGADLSSGLPQLSWDHGDLTSVDGDFELSWLPGPDAGGYDFVELAQKRNTGGFGNRQFRKIFLSGDSAKFRYYRQSEYEYQVRACAQPGDLSTRDCGEWSSVVNVTLTAAASTAYPTYDKPARGGASGRSVIPGGASTIAPGIYQSSVTQGNGWHLYWLNNLRRDQSDVDFNNSNELLVIWQTYMDLADSIPSSGEENIQPVWLKGHLSPLPGVPDQFVGSLDMYQLNANGDQEKVIVGEVLVDVTGVNRDPVVTWLVNDPRFYQNQIRYIVDDIVLTADVPGFVVNPAMGNIDHFQGWWWNENHGNPEYLTLLTYLTAGDEFATLLFYDNQGYPIWALGTRHNPNVQPVSTLTGLCLFTITDAWYPDVATPAGHEVSKWWLGGTNCSDADSSGWNLQRSFGPLKPGPIQSGELVTNLQIPNDLRGSSHARSINIGSVGSPVAMEKEISVHDVRHFIGGVQDARTCLVHPVSRRCELELNWFSDGDYPQARVFLRNLDSGSAHFVSDWPGGVQTSVEQFAHTVIGYGRYQYELRRNSSSNSPLIAIGHEFRVVSQDTEPAPAPAPDPGYGSQVSSSSSKVGATQGNFQVSQSGAANYSIPIMTVPGSGGLAPEVSINYSSEGGIGVMGRGWQIGGLSAITRCGQTIESGDGQSTGVQINEEDRFCLDGQRLILTSVTEPEYGTPGTQYRLENDQFVRITLMGTDAYDMWFKVERKDGSILTYGYDGTPETLSALVNAAAGKAMAPVFAWPVSRMQDSASNYIEFEYFQPDSNGPIEWHPLAIYYTGNFEASQIPFARIEFNYSPLPAGQRTVRYVAGAQVPMSQRLTSVDSFSTSDQLIRRYRLAYGVDGHGRDRLDSIQECWDTSTFNCFNPTTFRWNDATLIPSIPDPQLGGVGSPEQAPAVELDNSLGGRLADINGDGLTDYVFLHRVSQSRLRIDRSLASLTSEGKIVYGTVVQGPLLTNGNPSDPYDGIDADQPPSWVFIDLDGDSYLEFLYIVDGVIRVHKWSSSNANFDEAMTIPATLPQIDPSNIFASDWDGDGRTDIVLGSKVVEDSSVSGVADGISVLQNISQGGGMALSPIVNIPITYNLTGAYQSMPRCIGASPPLCEGGFIVDIGNIGIFIVDGQAADFTGDGKVEFLVEVRGTYCDNTIPGNCIIPRGSLPGQDRFGFFALMRVIETTEGQKMEVYNFIDESREDATPLDPIRVIRAADFNGDGLSDLLYYKSNSQWQLRLNTGDQAAVNSIFGPEIPQTNLNLLEPEEASQLNFAPIAGDGTLDLFGVDRISTGGISNDYELRHFRWSWNAYGPNQPGWGPPTTIRDRYGSFRDHQWFFQDLTSNGVVDTVRLVKTTTINDFDLLALAGETVGDTAGTGSYGYKSWFRINRITDGFGAWTDVSYKSLAQPSVHTREIGAERLTYGRCPGGYCSAVYDIAPAAYVVSNTTSLVPQYELNDTATGSTPQSAGTTRVDYYYRGARIQGGGRGFLGFREVGSYDPQSGMLTRTRYRQDFPFIGLPEATRSWYLSSSPFLPGNQPPNFPAWIEGSCDSSGTQSGIFLGCSENTWASLATVMGLTYSYLSQSQEWSFIPTYSPGGSLNGSEFTHRVLTINSGLDAFGNIGTISVQAFTSLNGSGDRVSLQSTLNDFDNDTTNWQLGRLTCSAVTSTRPGDTQTRRSTFAYDKDTGILNRETVNASGCTDADGDLKSVYILDDFGNRTQTTLSGTGIDGVRHAQSLFDGLGRFVNSEQVWLEGQWRETGRVETRDKYGNATRTRSGQGVLSWHYYDFMGRPYFNYSADGSWLRTRYYAGGHSECPSGTAFYEYQDAADGSRSRLCMDVLGRETRVVSWGLNGERIYSDMRYDYASRPIEVSEPYFSGQTAYWTRTVYDEIGRVEFMRMPDGFYESWSFSVAGDGVERGIHTRHQNVRGFTHITEQNALGETLRETAADGGVTDYGYDALGQLVSTDGPLSGIQDRISIVYDELGHKLEMFDPNKGRWYYRHSALGELLCQIDAEDHGVQIVYDELGRQTASYDRDAVATTSTCSGITRGTTTWEYGNTSGIGSFGQLINENSQYSDGTGANHSTERDFFYDTLGRSDRVDTRISETTPSSFSRFYTESTTYDQYGRVFQQFDASGDGRGIRYVYGNYGHAIQLREARGGVNGHVYWEVFTQDARGQTTHGLMGNGMEVLSTYDAATGRLTMRVDSNGHRLAFDQQLDWDAMGNLLRRDDRSGVYQSGVRPEDITEQYETFTYDSRDRLTTVSTHFTNEFGQWLQRNTRLRYDESGNILCKSDVSSATCTSTQENYWYGSGAGPHAVTQVGLGSFQRTFEYDQNGNVLRDRFSNNLIDRSFHYTSYNKLRRVSRGSEYVEFHYGADRSRTLKRELSGTTVTSRTHYVGSVEVVWDGSSPGLNNGEYRRMIGGVALVTFFKATAVERTRYLHKDHLGSISAISTETGTVEIRSAFDPWGQRRAGASWSQQWWQWVRGDAPVWAQTLIDITPRGFTGHEHVDSMGIIHMNGRIYDAQLGRFLQADPLVEDRTTLNRYTYVHNNPLAYTDPSGYLSRRAFGTILSIIGVTIGGQIGGTLGYIIAAASAFTGTYIATGTLDAAFTAAAFAVISVRIGELIPGPETTTTGGELSVSGVSKTTSQTVNKAASKTLPTADTVADSVGAAANAGGSASPPLVTSTPDTAILQNMTVTLKRKSLVELFSGAFSDLRSAVIAWSGITSSEVINDPTVDSTSRRQAQRQLEEYFGIGSGQTPWEAMKLVREMDQMVRIARAAEGAVVTGATLATGPVGFTRGLSIKAADLLRKSGQVLDRGGLTRAGRALQKHGDRPGSVFPGATGNVAAKNAQGQAALDDILSNVSRTHPNKLGGVDYYGGIRGGGARFDSQNNFIGFLEP